MGSHPCSPCCVRGCPPTVSLTVTKPVQLMQPSLREYALKNPGFPSLTGNFQIDSQRKRTKASMVLNQVKGWSCPSEAARWQLTGQWPTSYHTAIRFGGRYEFHARRAVPREDYAKARKRPCRGRSDSFAATHPPLPHPARLPSCVTSLWTHPYIRSPYRIISHRSPARLRAALVPHPSDTHICSLFRRRSARWRGAAYGTPPYGTPLLSTGEESIILLSSTYAHHPLLALGHTLYMRQRPPRRHVSRTTALASARGCAPAPPASNLAPIHTHRLQNCAAAALLRHCLSRSRCHGSIAAGRHDRQRSASQHSVAKDDGGRAP